MTVKELVQVIAEALVDRPEEVKISEIEGDGIRVLELFVAASDIGKVIGRQGRTADAIRTLVNAASGKEKKRTILQIND
jgi:hypothetical protein